MPPGIWDNSDIHKAQRHDAYKQASKRILELEKKLQNANEDKLTTISAERKRWSRADLLAIKIGALEEQAKGIEDVVNDCAHSMEATQVYVADLDCRADDLRKQAKALKDQG